MRIRCPSRIASGALDAVVARERLHGLVATRSVVRSADRRERLTLEHDVLRLPASVPRAAASAIAAPGRISDRVPGGGSTSGAPLFSPITAQLAVGQVGAQRVARALRVALGARRVGESRLVEHRRAEQRQQQQDQVQRARFTTRPARAAYVAACAAESGCLKLGCSFFAVSSPPRFFERFSNHSSTRLAT